MDVRRLQVLREVAARGSFAAAAEALSFTPSAVSQQIARLEREAGLPLVERDRHGARLTEAGTALVRRAGTILGELDEARAELDHLAGLRAGRIRLAAFPTATSTIVAQAIGAFRRDHPGVAIRLTGQEPFEVLAALRDRRADLGVVFQIEDEPIGVAYSGETICREDAVATQPLFTDRYVVALPEHHPLAGRGAIAPEALAGETLIGAATWPGLARLAARAAAAGHPLRFDGFISDDYQAVQALVGVGHGIAVLPSLATVRGEPGVRYRELTRWAPERTVLAALPAGAPTPPAVDAMLALLRRAGPAIAPT